MSLNLNDLLKKASEKGITPKNVPAATQLLRPWQQESTLYSSEVTPVQTKENNDQLVNNKETISKQLVNNSVVELVNNKETISKQLVNNKESYDDHILYNKETISKPIGKQNKETISKQLVNPLVNRKSEVSKLGGLQRKILFCIVDDCVYRGKLASGFITNETFREVTKTNADTVKTSIQRLIQKGLIKREEGQRGNGGFSSFTITEEVREAVLKEERNSSISKQLVNPLVNTISKPLVNHWGTDKETNGSSSSSSLKDLKTTTTELGEEWNFDITPYQRFGFSRTQLKQLVLLGTVSAANVEQSLVEFCHDLDNNSLPPIKTGKINFLMGLLRAGYAYVSEGFKNEQEAAISIMAKRAVVKRENAVKEKFEAWEAGLNDEERKEVEGKLPTNLMVLHRTHGISNQEVRQWLFNYYLELVK